MRYHVSMNQKKKNLRNAAVAIRTMCENMIEVGKYPKTEWKKIVDIALAHSICYNIYRI